MSTAAQQPEKRVRLQINTAGGWRNVIDFDAADHLVGASVMEHSVELAKIGKATLRIVTADGLQTALCAWTSAKGWYDFKTGAPLQ